MPSLSSVLTTVKPGRPFSTRKAEMPSVGLGAIRLGEHERRARLAPIGHEDLPAVEHVVAAVADGERRLVRGVGPRLRLRQTETAEIGSRRERHEEALLLRLRAEREDGVAVQRIVHRHDGGVGGAGLGHLLDRHGVGHAVAAAAAVRLGDGNPHEAELAHAADGLVRKARLAVDVRGDGAHGLLGELARHRLDHLLLVPELSVHRVRSVLHPGHGLRPPVPRGSSRCLLFALRQPFTYFSSSFLNSAVRSGATSKRSPTMP